MGSRQQHPNGKLYPSWEGFVYTTHDALVLLEACLLGRLSHIPRRPHDRERNEIIKSGAVFIYEENASGIKRWTDGLTWSPSRIMGNFLLYRQLEKPFPPGHKKRAVKRKRSESPEIKDEEPIQPPQTFDPQKHYQMETDRKLVGSLVENYEFKTPGLCKKTISLTLNRVPHHVICYYDPDQVKAGKHQRPGFAPNDSLKGIRPRPSLYEQQTQLRFPIFEQADGPEFTGVQSGISIPMNLPFGGAAPFVFGQSQSPHNPNMHPQHAFTFTTSASSAPQFGGYQGPMAPYGGAPSFSSASMYGTPGQAVVPSPGGLPPHGGMPHQNGMAPHSTMTPQSGLQTPGSMGSQNGLPPNSGMQSHNGVPAPSRAYSMPNPGHMQSPYGHPAHYTNNVGPANHGAFAQRQNEHAGTFSSPEAVTGVPVQSAHDLPPNEDSEYEEQLSPFDNRDVQQEMERLRHGRHDVADAGLSLRHSYSNQSMYATNQQDISKIAGNGSRPDSVVNAGEADINPGLLAARGMANGDAWSPYTFGEQNQYPQARRPTEDGHNIITGMAHHPLEFGDQAALPHDALGISDSSPNAAHPFSQDDSNPTFAHHDADTYPNESADVYHDTYSFHSSYSQ